MCEWLVMIYAGEYHTNPTWVFTVSADSKAMAIATAMWMFKGSAEYTDSINRVEAEESI
jgi:hypothetical protein